VALKKPPFIHPVYVRKDLPPPTKRGVNTFKAPTQLLRGRPTPFGGGKHQRPLLKRKISPKGFSPPRAEKGKRFPRITLKPRAQNPVE